jgi:hypothetical protein
MNVQRVLESFVARIWLERESDGAPRWRGHIQHVQGQQKAYFRSLGEMRAFLERVSGVPGPSTDGEGADEETEPPGGEGSG